MGSMHSGVLSFRRWSALLAATVALLALSLLPVSTADASPRWESVSAGEDLLTTQDRSALPRKARVLAALVPLAKLPKSLAGSNGDTDDHIVSTVEIVFAAPDLTACASAVRVSAAPAWAWTSRAPPQVSA